MRSKIIIRHIMKKRATLAVGVVLAFVSIALAIVVHGDNAQAAPASASDSDTVVNIERWVNPNGDRLAAVRPDHWRQPVYYIWLTQECAATLHVGDEWPSATVICR